MINATKAKVFGAPTPMAGLALGIASLGWCWENGAALNGYGQMTGAVIASVLLVILSVKFLFHRHLLAQDLAHPVVGSVVPTFAMATMVVSNALGKWSPVAGDTLWLIAVALHISFLASFVYHRAKSFELSHMVPSWFVPPVGIVVADVSFSGNPHLAWIAQATLIFGLVAYAVMLPAMIYRLIFAGEIPDAAKPTLAIMAAPASLSLAGYFSVTADPSPVIVGVLFGIAVLMTVVIYLAFIKLLRLPFSAGYAAFTFPMVIGSTALFKLSAWMVHLNVADHYIAQVHALAVGELWIATLVVGYVAARYFHFYQPHRVIVRSESAA
ncbi:TDT family transporter [Vibrio fluminensis]|uniref:TDT family transporter n=1 Tax=Vibrio fluminensis TaxID=2783614 RepID=UPI0018898012|nr:TDT family transporter [Vibrio fluminensis]